MIDNKGKFMWFLSLILSEFDSNDPKVELGLENQLVMSNKAQV